MLGYLMIAGGAALIVGGAVVLQVQKDRAKPDTTPVVSEPAAPKKQRWSIRLEGFAKEFNTDSLGDKTTPTTARFILQQDERFPKREEVEAPYHREGDDFVVTTEDPAFPAFVEKYWNSAELLLAFDHTIEFGPGNVTTGSHVIIRRGKDYVGKPASSPPN